jgi:phosphoglycolate phosphatase-like HAD superfamily hydrolase
MRLLLFDIDGTLLHANGAGATAIEAAVTSLTGEPATTDGVSFSGRTDPSIFRDVLRENGLSTAETTLKTVMDAYVEEAQRALHAENVDRLPGTASLLSLLSQQDNLVPGLVTGNVEPVAYHKLEAAGLAHHFSVGAFGSDHATRSKLPPLAAVRATEQFGHSFSMKDTIVIGDTPCDIDCAKEAGAYSMAVSTGCPTHSDLSSLSPDLLFETLENSASVMDQILDIFG